MCVSVIVQAFISLPRENKGAKPLVQMSLKQELSCCLFTHAVPTG